MQNTATHEIIEWAMEQDNDLQLYAHRSTPQDHVDGNEIEGEQVYCLSRANNGECIFGTPVDDIDCADYLVGPVDGVPPSPVYNLLSRLFGSWPDGSNIAQGWKIN